jgi:ATP-dependent DNA helicase Rep
MFERTEIKDIVAYLRLIANDDDDPAFLRAVARPSAASGRPRSRAWPTSRAPRRKPFRRGVRARARGARARAPARALSEFCELVNDLRYRAEREPAGRLLNELMARIGYEAWLTDTLDKRDAIARSKSVRDFTDWLVAQGRGGQPQPARAHAAWSRSSRCSRAATAKARRGPPVDAARGEGLEFAHVFIVGLEEGILPHRESVDAATSRKSAASCTSASRARDSRCTCHGAVAQACRRDAWPASRRASSASSRRTTSATRARR